MSPHTDPGALLKLADEIERACKAPNYEARLGTIEGKMVVAILRQAASQGSAGGGREAIARIIEPNGFHLLDELAKPESDGFPNRSEAENLASRQADLAYTKADAILALPKLTAAETSLQNPQTSPERPDHAQASLGPISDEMAEAGAKAMVLLGREHRVRGVDLPSRVQEARACLEAALTQSSRGLG